MPTRIVRPLSRIPQMLYVRMTIRGRDRGDVPGWVLVTIMTAGLVTVLWAVAEGRLTGLFERSLDNVSGP